MTTWRYQPVFRGDGEERYYSLCEVFFDDGGKLDGWTDDPEMSAGGNDPADLAGTLSLMLLDALTWEAVRFSDLKAGMTFERKLSGAQREALKTALGELSAGRVVSMAKKKRISFGQRLGHAVSDMANAASVAATGSEIGVLELAAEDEFGSPAVKRPRKSKTVSKKKKKAAPKKKKVVSRKASRPKKRKPAARRR